MRLLAVSLLLMVSPFAGVQSASIGTKANMFFQSPGVNTLSKFSESNMGRKYGAYVMIAYSNFDIQYRNAHGALSPVPRDIFVGGDSKVQDFEPTEGFKGELGSADTGGVDLTLVRMSDHADRYKGHVDDDILSLPPEHSLYDTRVSLEKTILKPSAGTISSDSVPRKSGDDNLDVGYFEVTPLVVGFVMPLQSKKHGVDQLFKNKRNEISVLFLDGGYNNDFTSKKSKFMSDVSTSTYPEVDRDVISVILRRYSPRSQPYDDDFVYKGGGLDAEGKKLDAKGRLATDKSFLFGDSLDDGLNNNPKSSGNRIEIDLRVSCYMTDNFVPVRGNNAATVKRCGTSEWPKDAGHTNIPSGGVYTEESVIQNRRIVTVEEGHVPSATIKDIRIKKLRKQDDGTPPPPLQHMGQRYSWSGRKLVYVIHPELIRMEEGSGNRRNAAANFKLKPGRYRGDVELVWYPKS